MLQERWVSWSHKLWKLFFSLAKAKPTKVQPPNQALGWFLGIAEREKLTNK